ncbi:Gfo/Idh/MocA family protein [Niabella ginsengisoli]|uniref:Gfo/Idh/MocA family oxidoreductase n=1 Tax=Niabella ginsengisoli TaxID=522298 RepID=A0ABS9SID5_9BACT|nr:Gfo/Idh/MocA family oxidoreductase [Niabella ginsengisoli]MCH5598119.1 Gfo/Idh/MocA family oxidoreductase [Niabella ginsengisoli]
MNRKKFLSQTAMGVAAFTIIPRNVLGGKGYVAPSDRIALGYIGLGRQSLGLLGNINKCKETIVLAACDVDKRKLERFVGHAEKENESKVKTAVKGYAMYRELLDRKDIDAVVIATPDHWHAQIVVDAAKAGKDIYCEKPLSLTIAEGRAMVDATRKHKRVFQTGSMQRSWASFRKAVELIRNGYIGNVKEVNVSVGPPPKENDFPIVDAPDYIDWDMWIGPSAYNGYSPVLANPIGATEWALWREYRNFGGGYVTDWGAHMFDIVQWALDKDHSGPVRFVPPSTPATTGCYFEYDNGIKVTHTKWGEGNAIQFIGDEGTLEVSRSFLRSKPENIVNLDIKATDKHVYKSDDHYQDWIDAVKKRSKPICDVEIGHRTASVCNAMNIAYLLQRPLNWNPRRETFNDDDADKLRSRIYRGNWDFTKF